MRILSALLLALLITSAGPDFLLTGREYTATRTDSLKDGIAQGKAKETDKKLQRWRPKFAISKETTYVTGPIGKDGYVDYGAALNERLAKGVTRENNANVLLWKAFGPHPLGGTMPAEFFRRMDIESPPEHGDYMIDLGQYLKNHLKVEGREQRREEIFDQLTHASSRPWKRERYPEIAAWLHVNQKPLAIAFEATKRTGYFSPLVSGRDSKGAPFGLVAVLLPGAQETREFANAFAARAMCAVAEGRYDDAWPDLLACHRLGRLVARGGTLIEFLVGVAIDTVASDADVAFVASADLSSARIKDCLRDLRGLPPMPGITDKVDVTERFVLLDAIMQVDRRGLSYFNFLGVNGNETFADRLANLFLRTIDWDPALRNANHWFDRMAAAMREKDRPERKKALDQIEEDLKAMKAKLPASADSGLLLASILAGKGSPSAFGKTISDTLVALMVPAIPKIQSASDHNEQVHRNLYFAFALAAYHRDHACYPDKLEALAPHYLPTVSQDLFTGKPLAYRPSANGYLLYSFGRNGKDDQGRGRDDTSGGDDISVRIPLPKPLDK